MHQAVEKVVCKYSWQLMEQEECYQIKHAPISHFANTTDTSTFTSNQPH